MPSFTNSNKKQKKKHNFKLKILNVSLNHLILLESNMLALFSQFFIFSWTLEKNDCSFPGELVLCRFMLGEKHVQTHQDS